MSKELEELEIAARKAQEAAYKANEAVREAKERAMEAEMEPLKELAAKAHDVFCRWNHTDGCGWGYETKATDPWKCSAHRRWLMHVATAVRGHDGTGYGQKTNPISIETYSEIVETIRILRVKYHDVLWLIQHGLEPRP